MPLIAEVAYLEANPEPAYPEYGQVRAVAEAMGPIMDPAEPARIEQVAERRGTDWCTAVLGRPYRGLRQVPLTEARMLLAADQQNLDPPLPDRVIRWRAEDAEIIARRAAAVEQARQIDRDRSAAALKACPVPVEVRTSGHSRRTNSLFAEPLAHIVPAEDAVSGRSRRHLVGRALCEAPTRAKPLQLSDGPADVPATCKSCLSYAPVIRAATDPRRGDFPTAPDLRARAAVAVPHGRPAASSPVPAPRR